MKSIYHFFRLIRALNLLVIGLTMTVVEVFLLRYNTIPPFNYFESGYFYPYYSDELSKFYLLLISTLLIAAAGNIINDYFDVKADRINKPDRLIIGRHIKRRWAMVLHWSFNLLGFILALYIGYVLQNVWIPIVSFLSINLLWFYSTYFKRKPLIGNVMVALLLGVIPIYVLVFNLPIDDAIIPTELGNHLISKSYLFYVILFLSCLAFLQNLIRELVKDIQDIRGDLRLNAVTFPIRFGIKKTKLLITTFWILTLLVMFLYARFIALFDFGLKLRKPRGINLSDYTSFDTDTFGPLLLSSLVIFVISFIVIISSSKIKGYKIASLLLKISMVLGLLTPLYL